YYSEPFADSSMVPTYYVARETRKHVVVALNGDGGDENFAGYTRYWQTELLQLIYRIYKKIPFCLDAWWEKFDRLYGKYPSNMFLRVLKWLIEVDKNGFDYAYARRLISFSNDLKKKIYSEDMKKKINDFDCMTLVSNIWSSSPDLELLEKMIVSDFRLYLPDVLMVKMDIASMANSLETRSPFLDHEFVELIASFPPDLKMRNFKSKYILKKKLKNFLPKEIIRRKKMGFGVPISKWFKYELKDYLIEVLLNKNSLSRGYFKADEIKKMVEEHISGDMDHSSRLWILLTFELWHKIFIDKKNA
ncbi:MAG: asparagine synthase C-terminal domain-containing protein, partial [bacterium]|nr:asparagine synthase C-terminal domain-containing protein [bacterium]